MAESRTVRPVSTPLPSDLPTTLPLIPLRRGVLLPGGTLTFSAGRPRTLAALQAARSRHDGWLVIAVQREPVEDPSPADLLPTAVLARVEEALAGPASSSPRASGGSGCGASPPPTR